MKVPISHADMIQLKAELLALAPTIKASHRVEAMARGLGFNSHAALLTALNAGGLSCAVNDQAFVAFLQARGGGEVADELLTEAVVGAKLAAPRTAIQAILNGQPELCANGFKSYARHRSLEEEAEYFVTSRQAMLDVPYVAQFVRALAFLETKQKGASVSRKRTSYGYKHDAEGFHRAADPDGDPYVANGMFIAAAMHLGFTIKRDGFGPNAFINIAAPKAARRSSQLAGSLRGPKKRAAWRNLMVAAVNAGLDQGQFGLAEDDNRWGDEYGIYRFTFEGLPAIACVRDIGHGELSVHAALNPTDRADDAIRSHNAGLSAGDGFASGWLERKTGAWLQMSTTPMGAFRPDLLEQVAATSPTPKGYADSGRVML